MGCFGGDRQKAPDYEFGYNSNDRSCTDILFLILFGAFWVGMIGIAGYSVSKGDLNRLQLGTDFGGNTCSITSDHTPTDKDLASLPEKQGRSWEKRQYLWFPVAMDMELADIRKLGVCVAECPKFKLSTKGLDSVITYETKENPQEKSWPIYYSSTPFLHRCVPSIANPDNYKEELKSVLGELGHMNIFTITWASIFDAKIIIFVCLAASLVICFIWTWLLQKFVAPMVYLALLLIFLIFLALGGLLFFYSSKVQEFQDHPAHEYATFFKIAGGVFIACALLFVCLVVFLWRRIRIAIEIIQMATQVLLDVKTLFLIPVFSFALYVMLVIYCIYVGALMRTAQPMQVKDLDIHAKFTNSTSLDYQIKASYFDSDDNTTTFMALYYIFGFFWTGSFLSAAAWMMMAFCAVFWYFSGIDRKSVPTGSVSRAIWWTIRYHIGTIALGSFLVAVVKFIRFLFNRVEARLKKLADANDVTKCLMKCFICCVHCCLSYFERLIKFINKNAYVICCITSKSFCPSCWMGLNLLMDNIARVGVVNMITDAVLVLMKVFLMITNALFAWILLFATTKLTGENSGANRSNIPPFLVVMVFSYIIASIFLHLFDTVADTLLMCFCYDNEVNNGGDKPYFMPQDLLDILNKHNSSGVDPQKGNVTAPPPPPTEANYRAI